MVDDDWDVEIPASALYLNAYDEAVETYENLLEAGMDKDQARKVLPIGTEVNMTFSANLRSLMHFWDLRISGAAQNDTIEFARKVMDEAEEWAPLTLDCYEEHARNQSLNSP
jgi:thymidylate synthase (FAD)